MRAKALLTASILTLAPLVAATFTGGNSASAGTGTPTFATYPAPSSFPNSDNAGEPSVGVNWNTGATMFQAYASTYRATFNDATVPATATWTDVTPTGSTINIDPILFTDSSVGRTYAGGLAGACSQLFSSDNDGGSWTALGNACAGALDHETIGAGPYHGLQPLTATYNRDIFYCAQNGQDTCVTSQNGGTVFGAPALAGSVCSSLHGHVKVSADGTAYLPNAHCGGHAGGALSSDNGSSWTDYVIPQSTEPSNGFDPSVATTPDNTVYQSWENGDFHPYVARSTTHGSTWDRVTDLSGTMSPPIVTSTFQDTVTGDNGRIAVSYLGSTTGGNPFVQGWPGVWDLYVSYSYDGGLTWTTVKATTDPVKRGWICAGGTSCTSGRNLLDFNDASVTKDGRVVVAYADGCINACAAANGTEAQSTDSYATISRQSTGKGLFAAYDSTGPSVPSSPTLMATAGNAQVALSWTAAAPNGSALTAYKVYRGTSAGGETLLATVGSATTGYTDTAVTNGTHYYYQVTAVNGVGESVASNEVSATPTAPSTNVPPTACFTHSEANLVESVNGGCSSDSDGSVSTYSWNWGDGSAASTGVSPSHTYAAAGTYTVALTVTDNGGATGSTSTPVTVTSGDPDPSTPNLTSGVATSGTSAPTAGSWNYYKISVPAGTSQLRVVLNGPSCGLLGLMCNPDLDLYVRNGAKPTTTTYDAASATSSNSETVTIASPATAYYYIGVNVYSGTQSGAFTVTATLS